MKLFSGKLTGAGLVRGRRGRRRAWHALSDAADQGANAAIQQVIQRSNDEQVQAIAARDPSLMADTLTADHYQELVQINQNLLEQRCGQHQAGQTGVGCRRGRRLDGHGDDV